jgi:DNA phosphorothioation-dependent restriction protein DptG
MYVLQALTMLVRLYIHAYIHAAQIITKLHHYYV